MDITEYLRFIRVIWEDTSLTQYINGIAFSKNIANKKMSKKIDNPKILILQGATDFYVTDKNLISMDKLIRQETSLAQIFIKKIEYILPTILILEGGLPQKILSELLKLNITTIMNVKMKVIKQIARATKAKILKSIDQASSMSDILGTCKEFCLDNLGKKSYVLFRDLEDSTRAGSLIISGPDKDELKKIEEIIKELALEYRNIKLEQNFFKNSGLKPESNLFTLLNNKNFKFRHLVICNQNYKICIKPTPQNIIIYTSGDKPLGEFITSAVRRGNDYCPYNCEKTLFDHSYYFVKTGGRVKVSYAKSHRTHSTDIIMKKQCKLCKNHTIRSTSISSST